MLETIAQMYEVCRCFPLYAESETPLHSCVRESLQAKLAHILLAFLSYLRLSIYMSVVSIAIIISFHLKHQPSALELKMAFPLGIVFWTLGMACLALGFGNYVKTVTKYSRKMALVQTGWKTQVIFTVISISIVGVCILFLSTNSTKDGA